MNRNHKPSNASERKFWDAAFIAYGPRFVTPRSKPNPIYANRLAADYATQALIERRKRNGRKS